MRTIGAWSFYIEYRSAEIRGPIGFEWTALDNNRPGRFEDTYGSGYVVPPDPMRTGDDLATHSIVEPLGRSAKYLRLDPTTGVRWHGRLAEADPQPSAFGQNLGPMQLREVEARLADTNAQIAAIQHSAVIRRIYASGEDDLIKRAQIAELLAIPNLDVDAVRWLHPERLRREELPRLRGCATTLQTWLSSSS